MRSSKITRVTKIGIRPTKDIEVNSKQHLFYANGIATSNSHSISYAINAYLSAYAKAHFTRIFFASYLKFAKDKIDPQQEIKELVKNANEMDVEIRLPDLRILNRNFLIRDEHIYFGLTDIKGVGESVFTKIKNIGQSLDLSNISYLECAYHLLLKINNTAAKALIACGALDFFKKNRTEMLFELDILSSLTNKEAEQLATLLVDPKNTKLENLLKQLATMKVTPKRREHITNLINSIYKPPYSLTDKIEWLSDSESNLLGVAISCSKLDSYDISMTNTTCKDFKSTLLTDKIIIAGEVSNINIIKTKKGKNPGQEMAFVSIEDPTGLLDSLIFFPEKLQEYKHHLFQSNVLIFVGKKTKDGDGLVVDKCFNPRS